MTTLLTESGTSAPVKRGKMWRVRIATPGQGSSGFYSAEVLREYGPVAIPAGTKAFLDHKELHERSLRDLVGVYPKGAYWDPTDGPEGALFADLKPATSAWAKVLDELGPLAEASIKVAGTKDEDDNVLSLVYSRANTVDLVPMAGLEGSGLTEQIESLVESARSLSAEEPSAENSAREKESRNMEEKLDKLIGLFESFIAKDAAKAAEQVQAKADADALAESASKAVEAYDAQIALIEAAREHLLPAQIADLRESAKSGAEVSPLIEKAKKVVEEAQTVLSESAVGREFGTGTEDWNVRGVTV